MPRLTERVSVAAVSVKLEGTVNIVFSHFVLTYGDDGPVWDILCPIQSPSSVLKHLIELFWLEKP